MWVQGEAAGTDGVDTLTVCLGTPFLRPPPPLLWEHSTLILERNRLILRPTAAGGGEEHVVPYTECKSLAKVCGSMRPAGMDPCRRGCIRLTGGHCHSVLWPWLYFAGDGTESARRPPGIDLHYRFQGQTYSQTIECTSAEEQQKVG